MIDLTESKVYEFGEFRLDGKSHRLYRATSGARVPLTPKAVELLLFLIESGGRIVTKDELLDTVWGNSFVEEANLSQTIFVLRKTLGENTKEPRFILTVPNRGYQFIASVKEVHSEDKILEESFLSDTQSKISNFKSRIPDSKTKDQKSKTENLFWFAAMPLVLLLALGVYWFYPATVKPATVSDIKTIAILPFEDLSAEQPEKYLGVSLADALTKNFSGLKQITVRPTSSVLKYAENRADIQKIGRELQVDAVLDGRIQREGSRVRVSVQLVRTSDNATIWTENFDDKFTNFFAVQDSISRKVVSSLAVKMDENERRRFEWRGTENSEAYQAYLRGRFFWNKRTAESLLKAIGHFDEAIAKDTNFALAYTGLADCYILLAEYHATTPHEAFPKAKAALRTALELDERSAEAHTALAYAQTFYDWDWPGAEASFKRALELNPDYATAHQWYGEYLLVMGRFGEAREHFERAIQLDPVSPIVLTALSGLYDMVGDYENEIVQSRKVLEIDPNFAYAHFYLGMGYERKQMFPEASETIATTMTLFGEPPECAQEVKDAFAKNGMKGWWQKRLEQIETRPHMKNFQAYHKALVQLRIDDREGALKSLDRAYGQRDRALAYAKFEQRLDPLRTDARFQDLLSRMGLSE